MSRRGIEVVKTELEGCVEIRFDVARDARGTFAKPFRASLFRGIGLDLTVAEIFFSASRSGVVRGVHFQAPPAAGAKLVTCIVGRVLDVSVDLRKGSRTYGRTASAVLDADAGNALYLPEGCGHGFAALTDATVLYATGSEYAPELDAGVRWDSVDVAWPFEHPVVSERDAAFPSLAELESPFEAAHVS